MNYTYPFDISWTKAEVIDVVQFFSFVEQAYEKGINKEDFLSAYRKFKQIVPSKSEEKKLFAEFQKESGYSSYHVVKKAKDSPGQNIIMK